MSQHIGQTKSDYQGDPFALLQYMINTPQSDVQSRTDDMQNLLSLIMNPQYGVAQGSYDYAQSLPPQGEQYSTPIISSFLNSASDVWRMVAERIANGTIDPIEAMGEIQNKINYSEIPNEDGMDLVTARGYVDQMFAEADGVKKTDDSNSKAYETWLSNTPYAKAGLPQPGVDYTLDTVPQQENTRQAYLDYLDWDKNTPPDPKLAFDFFGQLANGKLLETTRNKFRDNPWQKDRYLSLLQADLDSALESGRSPLSDALNARNSGLF